MLCFLLFWNNSTIVWPVFLFKIKKIYNLKINYFSLSRLTKLSSLYYCISHTCKDTDTFAPLLLKCLIGIDTQTFTQLSGQAFDLLKKGEENIQKRIFYLSDLIRSKHINWWFVLAAFIIILSKERLSRCKKLKNEY